MNKIDLTKLVAPLVWNGCSAIDPVIGGLHVYSTDQGRADYEADRATRVLAAARDLVPALAAERDALTARMAEVEARAEKAEAAMAEAMAQMVADREAGTPGPWRFDGPVWNQIVWTDGDNRLCFMAHSNGLNDDRDIANASRITRLPDIEAAYLTLAAENATLRAGKREAALQYLSDAGQAMDRIATLTEALEELRDLMCEGFEDKNGNSGCGMCVNECTGCIAHAAITTDKEPS